MLLLPVFFSFSITWNANAFSPEIEEKTTLMGSFSAHICCAQFAMATKGGQNSKKGDKN